MLMCIGCGNYFKESAFSNQLMDQYGYQCPLRNCGGDVVEIDELLCKTIYRLNNKGYTTRFCCTGHDTNAKTKMIYGDEYDECEIKHPTFYISFNSGIIIPPEFIPGVFYTEYQIIENYQSRFVLASKMSIAEYNDMIIKNSDVNISEDEYSAYQIIRAIELPELSNCDIDKLSIIYSTLAEHWSILLPNYEDIDIVEPLKAINKIAVSDYFTEQFLL